MTRVEAFDGLERNVLSILANHLHRSGRSAVAGILSKESRLIVEPSVADQFTQMSEMLDAYDHGNYTPAIA